MDRYRITVTDKTKYHQSAVKVITKAAGWQAEQAARSLSFVWRIRWRLLPYQVGCRVEIFDLEAGTYRYYSAYSES